MIVLSRHRQSDPQRTSFDRELAEKLAQFTGQDVLSLPFFYDLSPSSQTAQTLREISDPVWFLAPFPCRAMGMALNSLLGPPPETGWPVLKGLYTIFPDDTVEKIIGRLGQQAENACDSKIQWLEEPTTPRWYPIIDQKVCVGCLECVNFCLFGVYAIGSGDLPIVDQPDACRNGCPACSRVCPAAAIMFPMHEDEDIAGWHDAESVLQRRTPAEAGLTTEKKERQQHVRADIADDLDNLVDEVDKFAT